MLSRFRFAAFALLLAIPGARAQEEEDQEVLALEKQLGWTIQGASQGYPQTALALPLADKLIAKRPKKAEYRFARGVTLHHMLRFEEASAEFKKATELGMQDENGWNAGNPLGDWKKWSANAARLVPPLRLRHPDNDGYLVGVRYFKASLLSRVAEKIVPDLVKLAQEILGKVHPYTSIFIVESVEAADEIHKETVIDLRADATGLRPDAGAFGNGWGCHIYENFPDKNTPVKWTEDQIRAVVAHELCHGIAGRNRLGRTCRVPSWFEEGIAVYFDNAYLNVSEKDALARWLAAAKVAGGAPERDLVLGAFQNVSKSVGLNYCTALFMVRRLVALKGKDIIRKINDAIAVPYDSEDTSDFDEALQKQAGISADELYEATLKYLKEKLGKDYPPEKKYSDPWKEDVKGRMGGATVKKIIVQEASVGGIYEDFLWATHAPEAEDDYGKLFEGGYIDPKEKGVKTDMPAGYWVYYAPYWIVFGKKKKEE